MKSHLKAHILSWSSLDKRKNSWWIHCPWWSKEVKLLAFLQRFGSQCLISKWWRVKRVIWYFSLEKRKGKWDPRKFWFESIWFHHPCTFWVSCHFNAFECWLRIPKRWGFSVRPILQSHLDLVLLKLLKIQHKDQICKAWSLELW